MEGITEGANLKDVDEEKNPNLLPPETSLSSNVTSVFEVGGPSGSKEEPASSPENTTMEEHIARMINTLLEELDNPAQICAHHRLPLHHRHGLHSNAHSQMDSKQVKQQIPQRSRVQQLQYITALESSVRALQAQGLQVLAQLQYVDQHNFRLSNENEVLKRRISIMSQEHHTKCIQNGFLKREIHRLHQLLFQRQRRPPRPFTTPRSG